jgi:hypothetical protein
VKLARLLGCICLCVDGDLQPVCDSPLDLQPICGYEMCGNPPPALKPLEPIQLPPLGTSKCGLKQVKIGGVWQWVSICE